MSGHWDIHDQVRDFLGREEVIVAENEAVAGDTKSIKHKLVSWMYSETQSTFPAKKPSVWLLSLLARLMHDNGVELVLKCVNELEVELIGAGYELPDYYRIDLPESEISCVLKVVRPSIMEIDRQIDEREEARQKAQDFLERYK